MMVTSADSPIEPTPSVAAALRDRREPNSASTAALTEGNTGISRRKRAASPSHCAQRPARGGGKAHNTRPPKPKPNGASAPRHGQNEQKHDLTVGLMPAGSCDDECQTRRVEHHLKGHQDENQI